MTSSNLSSDSIFHSRLPFHVSKMVVGLLLATILLALLLTFSTIENINRAESHMRDFLVEKAIAIIHVLEAGSQTSAMHRMGNGNPLHTLLTESSKENDIVFIRVMDRKGTIIDQAGSPPPLTLSPGDLAEVLTSRNTHTQIDSEHETLIVTRIFNSKFHLLNMHMHDNLTIPTAEPIMNSDYVVSIGLLTRHFDIARKQDVHHTMFMGAILFLVGSAGLYLLFLYQGMRVAKSTIANMKLYTDSIIESIPVSLLSLDSNGKIVSCNRNAEELFGISVENIRGKKISELLPYCSLCTTSNCDNSYEHTEECKTADGRTIPVRLSCSSLVDHGGNAIGRVLTIRDMSAIRNMERQLERSRRLAALGKMATGIAHEIRNPLGTLRGFAQFFGNHASTLTEKQYADLMVSEVDRLNQTVSGLLQFARPRQPQIQLIFLDELFNKLFVLMKPDFVSSKVQFDYHRNTGIQLMADPDLLLQVLMNLLKNSINATPPEGSVNLLAHLEDTNVRITISDNGCGMKEKERDLMFDPFFSTTKTGTGLGLAVSHQIIEQHKGSFEVQTAPDKGTTISLILPQEIEGP